MHSIPRHLINTSRNLRRKQKALSRKIRTGGMPIVAKLVYSLHGLSCRT
ncbi:hypothetical protein [Photorhabdus bodei]|nr:hypothetical protein [Photorhabdus bodei]